MADNLIYHGDDAAADWYPEPTDLSPPSVTWYGGYAPCFDEWNAARLIAGQPEGDFSDYLTAIGGGNGE